MTHRRRFLILPLFVALVTLAGCDDKPRAPVLTNEAVYSNSDIGLTFVAPEGWVLYAKVNPPAGQKFDRPQRLVAYQSTGGGDRKGGFDLYAIDLPEGTGLLAYLKQDKMAIGSEKWTDKGPPASETINGTRATRYVQTGAKADRRRELIEFRRPDRTYVFTMTYKASDTQTREQVQRAVQSATWK